LIRTFLENNDLVIDVDQSGEPKDGKFVFLVVRNKDVTKIFYLDTAQNRFWITDESLKNLGPDHTELLGKILKDAGVYQDSHKGSDLV
jgi:hypothetical protein